MTRKNVKHALSDGTEIEFIRLTADAGKIVTNGTHSFICVDVLPEDENLWYEVGMPEPEAEEEATIGDYERILSEVGI